MPLKKGEVTASPSMKLLLPTVEVALLALKVLPELDGGGRVGPCQGVWVCKDSGVNHCNNKVGRIGMPSGVGHRP
jgi:hypothetical protein